MKEKKKEKKNIFCGMGKQILTTIKYISAVLGLVGMFFAGNSFLQKEFVLASTFQLLAADFSQEKLKNSYITGDMELARIDHKIERIEDKYGENPKDPAIRALLNQLRRDAKNKSDELLMLKQKLLN